MVSQLVKKDNFIKSIAFLTLIVGIGFFAFENRKVFAEKLTNRATTQTELTPDAPKTTEPLIEPSQQNKQQTQIIQGERQSQVIVVQTPTQIVQAPQSQVSRITERITSAETKPLVLKPEFLAPSEILNPKAFNKRKFGIDTDLARSALSKTEPERTIAEKKQLENLKAMGTFDSSKITNF